jgi:hypothetical protein
MGIMELIFRKFGRLSIPPSMTAIRPLQGTKGNEDCLHENVVETIDVRERVKYIKTTCIDCHAATMSWETVK